MEGYFSQGLHSVIETSQRLSFQVIAQAKQIVIIKITSQCLVISYQGERLAGFVLGYSEFLNCFRH